MDFDPSRQAELERDRQWLASLPTPRPSEEAIERVRAAVRLAMDEQWLHSIASPAPPPELIRQVKAAVRDTLRAGGRAARYRIFGVCSAAATVLFAIGVARFAAMAPHRMAESPALAEEFIAAWSAIENDADLRSLTADMVWLDDELSTWASKPAARADDLDLESLQDRIDQIFATPDYFYGTS